MQILTCGIISTDESMLDLFQKCLFVCKMSRPYQCNRYPVA